MRATSAPNTYIFTDLLETPQIQALGSSDEFATYLKLLETFSYGTYSSYISTPGLPDLNDAQRLKLRQLSLLTLAKRDDTSSASHGERPLSYASLQKALDLPTRRSLEELVISCVYAGLLKAQLNPKDSLVHINSVAPLRDVGPASIANLLSRLETWAGRCDSTLRSLSSQMAEVRADADRRAAQAAARAAETNRLIESEKKGGMMAPSSPSSFSPSPTPAPVASFPSTVPAAAGSVAMSDSPQPPMSSLCYPSRNDGLMKTISSNEASTSGCDTTESTTTTIFTTPVTVTTSNTPPCT